MFTAVIRVSGAGRLADFRERVRWLMVRDAHAEDYTEHHAAGLLEYRFTPKLGIPFPAFTQASADFPELQVEAEWEHDGTRGRALIENGRLVQAPAEPPAGAQVDVTVEEDGRLSLALACAPAPAGALRGRRRRRYGSGATLASAMANASASVTGRRQTRCSHT